MWPPRGGEVGEKRAEVSGAADDIGPGSMPWPDRPGTPSSRIGDGRGACLRLAAGFAPRSQGDPCQAGGKGAGAGPGGRSREPAEPGTSRARSGRGAGAVPARNGRTTELAAPERAVRGNGGAGLERRARL